MWNQIKDIIKQLFASKKFVALLAGLVVWVLGKAGLELSDADVLPALALIASYIVGQGIADNGKEAAKIGAQAAKEIAENPPSA